MSNCKDGARDLNVVFLIFEKTVVVDAAGQTEKGQIFLPSVPFNVGVKK